MGIAWYEVAKARYPISLLTAQVQGILNHTLTRPMAGIRTNCVSPWYINTPLAAPVLQDKKYMKEVLERTPMRRVGQPEVCSSNWAFSDT